MNALGSASDFTSILGDRYYPYAGINNQNLTAGLRGDEASTLETGNTLPSPLGKLLPTDDISIAFGLNDLRQVVGKSGDKGFIYDPSTLALLDANLLQLSGASFDSIIRINDINHNGSFVGIATINGIEHGFIGTTAFPEPTSLGLVGIALLIALARKRLPRKLASHRLL